MDPNHSENPKRPITPSSYSHKPTPGETAVEVAAKGILQKESLTSEKNGSKKWLIIVLALLFLAVSGSAGYFAYQNCQLSKQFQEEIKPTPFPRVVQPSPSLDSTDDWLTYDREAYSFKYPSKLFSSISNDGQIIFLLSKEDERSYFKNCITNRSKTQSERYSCELDLIVLKLNIGAVRKYNDITDIIQGEFFNIIDSDGNEWKISNTSVEAGAIKSEASTLTGHYFNKVTFQTPLSGFYNFLKNNIKIEGDQNLVLIEKHQILTRQILSTYKSKVQEETIGEDEWRTYIRLDLGFELRYPPTWVLEDDGVFWTPSRESELILIFPKGSIYNECMDELSQEKATYGNKTFELTKYEGVYTPNGFCSSNPSNKQDLEIWAIPTDDNLNFGFVFDYKKSGSSKSEELLYQVLSSIKFIE